MGYLYSDNKKDTQKRVERWVFMLCHKDNRGNRCLHRETHLTASTHLLLRCDTLSTGWAQCCPPMRRGTWCDKLWCGPLIFGYLSQGR